MPVQRRDAPKLGSLPKTNSGVIFFQSSKDLTRRWPNIVRFVPVTTRWRSDAHMMLLDVTEDQMSLRGQMEIGELSRWRVQLSLAPSKGKLNNCPAIDHA
ncbi:hypothetical protein AVEN_239442-1 [Araneus ventricosus]|uniref:Uncharacterized protein n=1 Tax=Araneus ventricosus TaxID=182803 RepID=A0A4Y2N744_ARAVE|nr:hypothetical protein AVEN_239442-1 [Araneus ventricosus]